ncbi:MAG: hypothetical protein WBL35_03940 [Ornithinibacter sp.]
MSETSTAAGTNRNGLIILVVSLLAGLGMSFAAAATIVSTNGPQDGTAITEGQVTLVPADVLLNYGG